MTVEHLINELEKYDKKSEVVTDAWNGHTSTYALVDFSYEEEYQRGIYNDLYGTPGIVDSRLIPANWKDKSKKYVYISSRFPDKYKFGDNDIDYPIRTLNGEDGDPDLLWKLNDFEHTREEGDNEYGVWSYLKEFTEPNDNGDFEYEMINWWYDDESDCYICELNIRRDISKPCQTIQLINPGIETLRNAMELLKFEKILVI